MRFIVPVLLIVLGAVLWMTNPGEEQFTEFLTEEVTQIAGNAGAEGAGAAGGALGFLTERLGREVGETLGAAIAREASTKFERSSYGVASTYTLDLNGRASGGTWEFVGVAGQFYPIEQPENLETLVRDMLARR